MWLKLSKVFLALLILYTGYFQAVFFPIPIMLLILGSLLVLFLLIHMYQQSTPISNGFTIEIVLWLVFAFSSLFIGYVIVDNKSHLLSSIFTLIQNIIFIIVIVYISKHDENIDYIINILLFLALISALTTIFWGKGYMGGQQISLTAHTNPNGFGILLVTGIFCLLYKLDINKRLNLILVLAGIGLIFYVVIIGGSRNTFLAAILLITYWFLFGFGTEIKKGSSSKRIRTVALVVASLTVFVYFILPIFNDTVLLKRLTSLFEVGAGTREKMYGEAIQMFLSNPLFGVGYNNYRILSIFGTYSHSTYAEVLACTGLLGGVLYFIPYLSIAFKTIMIIKDKYLNIEIKAKAHEIFGVFMALLFMGIAAIHFYEIYSIITFAMIISFNKLHCSSYKLRFI